jgi:hypothetical protein
MKTPYTILLSSGECDYIDDVHNGVSILHSLTEILSLLDFLVYYLPIRCFILEFILLLHVNFLLFSI